MAINVYFPAANSSPQEIEITDTKPAPIDNAWVANAFLPNKGEVVAVVIYKLERENGEIDYRLVPAACPHQGYDISYDPLKSDGNVYCSLHRRPICVFSEHNRAYAVSREEDRWFIPAS